MRNKRYVVEKEFDYLGYKCVVTFNTMGFRCGYVGLPKEHCLFGKTYDDYLDIKKSDIEEKEISGVFPMLSLLLDEDERISIECYFNCLGGITYSNGGRKSNYPINSDLWWFGFDCAHAGDKADLNYAMQKFPNRQEEYRTRLLIENKYLIEDDVIRTEEYVAEECKKLAEQLKIYDDNKSKECAE